MNKANQTAALKHSITSDKLFKALTDSKSRLYRHLSGILFLLWLLPAGKKWGEFSPLFDHLDWIFSFVILVSIFYINMYKLTPRFIYRGKAFLYLGSLTLTITAAALLLATFRYYVLDPNRIAPIPAKFEWLASIVVLFMFLGPFLLLSSALKLLQRWINDIYIINELEKRATESELAALRNQIHPHFLFNMLNNINVLTATEPEKASNIIIKLSSFLRHLIYESDRSDQIYLSSEIKFIQDYLELENIRRDNFSYSVEYDAREVRGVRLPANIIIILVENAIKHSADSHTRSFVDIKLKIKDNYMHFTAVNSMPEITRPKAANSSGVGLANIKRRLELLFAGSGYELSSDVKDRQYTAFLKLPV